jgi:hypothetical protein
MGDPSSTAAVSMVDLPKSIVEILVYPEGYPRMGKDAGAQLKKTALLCPMAEEDSSTKTSFSKYWRVSRTKILCSVVYFLL